MFFILNNEKSVLAADQAFLDSVGTSSIYLLAELFLSGEFKLDEANSTCQIKGDTRSFSRKALHTIFGQGYLYEVTEVSETVAETVPIIAKQEASKPEEDGSEVDIESENTLVPFEINDEPDSPVNPESIISNDPHEAPESFTLPEVIGEETPSEPSALQPASLPEDDLLDLINFDDEPSPIETPSATSSEEDLLNLIDLDDDEAEKDTLADSDADASVLGIAADTDAAILATHVLDEQPDLEPERTPLQNKQDNEIFDLIDPDKAEPPLMETVSDATLDEINVSETPTTTSTDEPLSTKTESTPTPIEEQTETYYISDTPFADYESNAQLIGISFDEYIGFLKQFAEESLSYKPGLKSNDLYVFKKNLTSIKDASQLLHLPKLSENLLGLEEATSNEREALINTFFGMIQHIRRDLEVIESHQPLTRETKSGEAPSDSPASAPVDSASQADTSTLSSTEEITPIPFEFSTKAASDELGLPEALVQEFVSDFVKQAEENVEVFQIAQQTGDIETIQKTAHLLKGAASNLRIDPLAETLKELQYNEEPDKVPDLFRQFVGQLKALVNFTRQSDI
jgi:HPt (histidine-containing phosphotransfer) domain-containing protein